MDPGKSAQGKETTTTTQDLITTEPLRHKGPAALDLYGITAFKKIVLSTCKLTIKGLYPLQLILSGPGILTILHLLPSYAEITTAIFDVTRQGSDQSHKIEVTPPDTLTPEDPADLPPFRQFALAHGILRASAQAALALLLALVPPPLLHTDDADATEDLACTTQPQTT